MKAIAAFLLLNILGLIQSDSKTQSELIGKWNLEGVRVVHPGLCFETNFDSIIGSTWEFTHENLLIITSLGGKELLRQTEKLSWSVREDEFILKSSMDKERQTSKYRLNGDRFSFQISNLIEIALKKK